MLVVITMPAPNCGARFLWNIGQTSCLDLDPESMSRMTFQAVLNGLGPLRYILLGGPGLGPGSLSMLLPTSGARDGPTAQRCDGIKTLRTKSLRDLEPQ